MTSRPTKLLPQEGTRKAGEPLLGTGKPGAKASDLSAPGKPLVSGGGIDLHGGVLGEDEWCYSSDEAVEMHDLESESRKRAHPVVEHYSDDDEFLAENEYPAAALLGGPSTSRGRGAYLGTSVGLRAAQQELSRLEEEDRSLAGEREKLRKEALAEKRKSAPKKGPAKGRLQSRDNTISVPTAAEVELATQIVIPWEAEPGGPSAQDVHEVGILCARAVREVSRKSGNIKATLQKTLNNAANTMTRVMSNLSSRTLSVETKDLREDNKRMRLELQSLRAEVDLLRKEVGKGKKSPSCSEVPSNTGQDQNASGIFGVIQRSLNASIGELSSRLDGIESRLPGSERTRPLLAADRRRSVEYPPLPAPIVTNSSVSRPPAKKTSRLTSTTTPVARRAVMPTVCPSVAVPASPSEMPQAVTRGKKGRRRGKRRRKPLAEGATPSRPQAVSGRHVQGRTRGKTVRVNTPRSAAIIITLRPEAIEGGVTYAQTLQKAIRSVPLADLGITAGVRTKMTATGARLVEVYGQQNRDKADLLAGRLKEVISDVATVVRTEKCVSLRISDLGESVTKEALLEAIATKGGCSQEFIRVGNIRMGPNKLGATIVSCPTKAAKAIVAAGRLLLSWSAAQVTVLEPRPMRCFRCMGVGHTRPRCPSDVDRTENCFRCGQIGHRAATCSKKESHCAVCAAAGIPHKHVMGGRGCSPPATRGITSASGLETIERELGNERMETVEEVASVEPPAPPPTQDAILKPKPTPERIPIVVLEREHLRERTSSLRRSMRSEVQEEREREALREEEETAKYEAAAAAADQVRSPWRRPSFPRSADGKFASKKGAP